MEIKDLENELRKYRENLAIIKLKRLKQNDCRRLIDKINEEYQIKITATYTEGAKGGGNESNIEKMVIKKEKDIERQKEQIEKIQEEIDEIQRKIDEIDARLQSLPDYLIEIIRLRYINANSIEEIAYLKCKTTTTISRQILKALKRMSVL